MALKSITMTESETAIYNRDNDTSELLQDILTEQAMTMAQPGDMVEIYTADGIVAYRVTRESDGTITL